MVRVKVQTSKDNSSMFRILSTNRVDTFDIKARCNSSRKKERMVLNLPKVYRGRPNPGDGRVHLGALQRIAAKDAAPRSA